MRAWQSGKNLLCNSADTYVKQMGICFFYVMGFRCQNILICIKKIAYKIFEKTNINRHNAKRKYGTYAQKIVLTTYEIMQVAYKMVENAHKYNKNAQKEYLLWTHKMLICIKWQNYIHENYNNVTKWEDDS